MEGVTFPRALQFVFLLVASKQCWDLLGQGKGCRPQAPGVGEAGRHPQPPPGSQLSDSSRDSCDIRGQPSSGMPDSHSIKPKSS